MNFLIAISKFFQKIDWKIALIVILLAGSVTFGLLWYFKDDNKSLLTQLDKENKEIIADRKIIKHQIDSLQAENIKLTNEKIITENDLEKVNNLLIIYISKSNKSQGDLANKKKIEDQINAELDKLEKNPNFKSDDQLLTSLRQHLRDREQKFKNIK